MLRPELAVEIGPERFLREIERAAGLNPPHILPLLDSGEAGGFLCYVMPHMEGESLREKLTREKQLPLDDALQIAREVADALGYAHNHDVVHRDIKPGNILLQSGHAVVADFGIARAITAEGGGTLTATGMAQGTPAYMSPEQAAGSRDLDGRSDLYSLGCVLYEMLAGQPPFTGPPESLVYQHLSVEPRPVTDLRPAVQEEVERAIHRTLAKTPADRFGTAAQFAEALAAPTEVSVPKEPPRAGRGGLVAVSDVARDEDALIPTVGRIAGKLRAELGERRSAIEATRERGEGFETPSFEAFRRRLRAIELVKSGKQRAAITVARSALALDPDYAGAWGPIGFAFPNLGEPDSALEAFAQALARPGRLSERTFRLLFEAAVANLKGDLPGALASCERLIQLDPRYLHARVNRGVALWWAGRSAQTLESFKAAEKVSPFGPSQGTLGNQFGALLNLGRIDEARRLAPRLTRAGTRILPYERPWRQRTGRGGPGHCAEELCHRPRPPAGRCRLRSGRSGRASRRPKQPRKPVARGNSISGSTVAWFMG